MEKKKYVTKKEVLEAIPGGLLGISISSVMFGMALMSCVVSAGEYNLVNFFWGI